MRAIAILKENGNKIQKLILYLLPLLVMAIALLFKKIYYITFDDNLVILNARGAYTEGLKGTAQFVNVVLASLWKKLYSINDYVEWISLTYLVLCITCVYTSIYLLKKYIDFRISVLLAVTFECIIFGWFSFTTIAYFSTLFGMLLLLETFGRFKKNGFLKNIVIITGIIMLIVGGCLIRFEACLACVALIIPLLVYYMILLKSKSLIFTLMITLLCTIISPFINKIASNEVQRDYSKWDSMRSESTDYPITSFDEDPNFYRSIGFSKNDYKELDEMYLGDKEVFSESNLKKIVENTSIDRRYELNIFKILLQMAKLKETWLLMFLIIVLLISSSKKVFIIAQSLFTYGLVFLLHVLNRPKHRALVPIYIMGGICIIFYYIKNNYHDNRTFKRSMVCIVLIAILAGGISLKQLRKMNVEKTSYYNKHNEVFDYLEKNQKNKKVYVLSGIGEFAGTEPVDIFGKKRSYSNVMCIIGYDLYNEVYYYNANRYNLKYKDRLLLDIAYNDNVEYIDIGNKGIDKNIKKYLDEHISQKVKVTKIKEFKRANTSIYKYTLAH